MAKAVFKTDLSNIRLIGVISNPSRNSLATIKSDEGVHGICNGTLYNTETLIPNCNELWIDGKKIWDGNYPGYELGSGLTPGSQSSSFTGDFVGGFPDFKNGKFTTSIVDSVKVRGRTVLGRTSTQMLMFCVSDDTTYGLKQPDLEAALNAQGVIDAINLDGGGSSQCDFGTGYKVTSSRIVVNHIAFWFWDQAMPVRKQGAKGLVVKEIQRILNAKGASPKLDLDGSFGPATLAAVKAFQAAQGLAVDGSVGPATWAKLDA